MLIAHEGHRLKRVLARVKLSRVGGGAFGFVGGGGGKNEKARQVFPLEIRFDLLLACESLNSPAMEY